MQLDELNKKIEEAFNSDLVGEVIFSKDELEQIPSTLSKHYNFEYSHYLDTDDAKKIFVYITNLTRELKLSGSNERWRPYIKKHLDFLGADTWSDAPLNKLFKVLFETLQDTGVILITLGGKQYYDTFMCHAISPIESWNSFFELCWFYLFRHPLFDDNEDNRKLIAERLAIRFRAQLFRENFIDESIKIGSQSYEIRIGIKVLGLEPYQDLLYRIIMKVYNCQVRISQNQTLDQDNYINDLFNDWYQDLKNNAATKEKIRPNSDEEHPSFIPSVFYEYDSDEHVVHVSTSKFYSQAILSSSDILEIYFYFNGECICSKRLYDIDYDELLCTVAGIRINLDDLMFKSKHSFDVITGLTADIKLNGELLVYQENVAHYDLKRDFILFPVNVNNISREITKHECSVKPYFIYVSDKDINSVLIDRPHACTFLSGHIYSVIPENGEVIASKKWRVLFSDEPSFEKTVFYPLSKQSNATYRCDNVSYEICKCVMLKIDNSIDLSSLCVKCIRPHSYATIRRLSELYDDDFAVESDTGRYKTLFLQLSKVGLNWLHPFTMKLYDEHHNPEDTICSVDVVRINDFSLTYDETLTTEHSISFKAKYYDKKNYATMSLVASKNKCGEFTAPFLDGELVLSDPPIFAVKLSNDSDFKFVDELHNFYYRDIANDAQISFKPKSLNFEVKLGDYGKIESDDLNNFGESIHKLANRNDISVCPIATRYQDPSSNENKTIFLFNIYYKPSFEEFPIKTSGDLRSIITWDPGQLIGGGGPSSFVVEFTNTMTDRVYRNDGLELSQREIITDMPYGDYKCVVYAKNGFGGLTEISRGSIKYGADDLINDVGPHVFRHIHLIDERLDWKNDSGENERIYPLKTNLLIDNSVKISEYQGNPVYMGDLFAYQKSSKIEQCSNLNKKIIWVKYPDPKVMNVICVRVLSDKDDNNLVSADYYQDKDFDSFQPWKIDGKLLYELVNKGKAYRTQAGPSTVLALSQ